jgi:hypothetical protein
MNNYLRAIMDFFSDDDDPDEAHYDPLHVGAMVVITLFGLSILFWLLWALLVFGGGLQAKIIPALQLLLGVKKAAELGYAGYPFQMGVFEGWVTNVIALVFLTAIIGLGWYVFKKKEQAAK